MIKLVLIGLIFVGICEAAISSLQLLIPDNAYNVLTNSKSSTNNIENSISSLSNTISGEDKSSSRALSQESNESVASSDNSQSTADAASTANPSAANTRGSAPAAITRGKSPITSSSISSTAGISKGSLLISSTARASATANSPSASRPVTSVKSTATIQHRILPAEVIPLPISISTRPGLRTVIAPETITIQQPGIAKVGEVVQQIPTAVSHQRQTVVHNHARVVTPIVAPAVRTVTSQIVRVYHTPLVFTPHVVENQD